MALTFTNARIFTAANSSTILNGLQTASLLIWFRYEPSGSQSSSVINGTDVFSGQWDSDVYLNLYADSTSGFVDLLCGWTNGSYMAKLAVGVVYPMLMVYTQGQQTLYLPGQSFSMGTATGSLATANHSIVLGGSPPGTPCVYTVGDVNLWAGYACTQADYNSILNGSDPSTIGKGATSRYRWTLAGTVGATPAIGDAGLNESYAGSANFASVSGTGSAVYVAPLTYSPSVQVSPLSRVGTSGQSVFFFFETISTGASSTPISVSTVPTLYQNGTNVGSLTNQFLDGIRPYVMYNLPAGIQINPGDVLTASAPAFWCTTPNGPVAAMNNVPIVNKSGVSAFGTESLTKTLRMGLNIAHPVIWYSLYRLQRNQRYNIQWGSSGITLAADGTPLSFPGTAIWGYLEDFSSISNQIDSTNYPSQPGLRAVGWNSPPSSNTQFGIWSGNSATTTVTERTDLANPGDANGNGRVRVFDVEHAAGSTTAALQINLFCEQANGTPDFSNLQIFGPGDFTYTAGQPVTLNQSNPYALSAATLSRFQNSVGSLRYMDSTLNYGAKSNACEPWHLQNLTNFSWFGPSSPTLTVTFTEARPFNPTVSPYIYGPSWILPAGSPFTATLAASIDNQTTTLSISDAATAPVLVGLTLSIGSELMTVTGVSGTTVTVVRGAGNTIPAAHNAGPIQVQNRLAVSSLAQIGFSNDQVTEFVCSAPHGLSSGIPGLQLNITSAWPNFTYTDGSTFNFSNYPIPVMVTGPTTFLTKQGAVKQGPVTLSQSYTLSGVVGTLSLPDPGYPYEFTAMASGTFPGCWHHANIPIAASDSLVYEIARRIRDNFPPLRKVLVELSDEPWNWLMQQSAIFHWCQILNYPSSDQWTWLVSRSAEIWQIFINVFNETGRGDEIVGLLNSQFVVPGNTQALLADAQAQGITIPFWICTAPYWDPADWNTATVAAYNNCNFEQAIDLLIHDVYYAPNNYTAYATQHNEYIAAYNASTGQNVHMYAYECDYDCGTASSNYPVQQSRDILYHPNFWIAQQDFWAWLQINGYVGACIYSYDMDYEGGSNWGMYCWPNQPYGRGDGSDGKADNRLCLATPGLPHSKAANVNQDQQNVSVRGSAFLNWMRQVMPTAPKKHFVPRRKR